MHDFSCTDARDMKYRTLAERVRYFKEDEKGVAAMCKAMEDMRNEAKLEERKEIADQIQEYKEQRGWLQKGVLSYLEVPNENYIAWSVVSVTGEECEVIIMQKLFDPRYSHGRIHLCGLHPEWDYKDESTGQIFGGDELMEIGVSLPLIKRDFHTFAFHFSKVKENYGDQINCK